MKQPEIKAALIGALEAGMDAVLGAHGFRRSPKGLVYTRTQDGTRYQFAVEFASNPSYAPGCIAHLTPALRIEHPRLAARALQLAEDPWLLANAGDLIHNRRLTALPKPPLPEWYVASLSQLPGALAEIRSAFIDHGLSFLDDYATVSGMIRQHEAGDTRALAQQHHFVFVIAAYLLEGRPEAAHALLHAKFAKPGLKKKFATLWRNMDAIPNAQ